MNCIILTINYCNKTQALTRSLDICSMNVVVYEFQLVHQMCSKYVTCSLHSCGEVEMMLILEMISHKAKLRWSKKAHRKTPRALQRALKFINIQCKETFLAVSLIPLVDRQAHRKWKINANLGVCLKVTPVASHAQQNTRVFSMLNHVLTWSNPFMGHKLITHI